jgi:hypothetical protein
LNILNEQNDKNEIDKEINNKMNELREDYANISSILNDERNLKLLKKQINRRKSKRKREYRNRIKDNLDKILKEKVIEQKNIEIDEKLKLINDKIKQEKEVKSIL